MNVLINAAQEIFFFDTMEAMFILSLFLLNFKLNISMKKFIFHTLMLAILDYIVNNLFNVIFGSLPLNQVTGTILAVAFGTLMFALYFFVVFKFNFVELFVFIFKALGTLVILEMIMALLYNGILSIELVNMSNNLKKFFLVLPIRGTEGFLIYIFYKRRK